MPALPAWMSCLGSDPYVSQLVQGCMDLHKLRCHTSMAKAWVCGQLFESEMTTMRQIVLARDHVKMWCWCSCAGPSRCTPAQPLSWACTRRAAFPTSWTLCSHAPPRRSLALPVPPDTKDGHFLRWAWQIAQCMTTLSDPAITLQKNAPFSIPDDLCMPRARPEASSLVCRRAAPGCGACCSSRPRQRWARPCGGPATSSQVGLPPPPSPSLDSPQGQSAQTECVILSKCPI